MWELVSEKPARLNNAFQERRSQSSLTTPTYFLHISVNMYKLWGSLLL